ncbi:MAG: asparagine synthase [Deltaproteobacteria bacterium]|nr:asparagine synthase [Deltaproteobacteria bacterium]
MSGIAGIARPGEKQTVNVMLDKIAHRGPEGRKIIETPNATLGLVWTKPQQDAVEKLQKEQAVFDSAGIGRLAAAQEINGALHLYRDALGVAPLYFGNDSSGALCFASEVKALVSHARKIAELPPGHRYEGTTLVQYFTLQKQQPVTDPPEVIAKNLKGILSSAVGQCIASDKVGSWLSGGLDSSVLAALARKNIGELHTFAAGFAGAPDLEYAREVARFIDSKHHECIVDIDLLLNVLPSVIYHLESFDALLVRSSTTNYLVAKRAAEHVDAVYSGEGGDELFAGYEYLKGLDPSAIADELIDIIGRLHNTALQRVDRSSTAHGTIAYVPFTNPDVLAYALRIPTDYKLRAGVEKWILREAMEGELPERVLRRTKAKFWEGAGVVDLLAQHAEKTVTDNDFQRERTLPNGWMINTKEELMYYRIFREHFGTLEDFDWMGRTKGAPVQ